MAMKGSRESEGYSAMEKKREAEETDIVGDLDEEQLRQELLAEDDDLGDDPEFQEMKAKLKAEMAKATHKRENTIELSERIQREVEERAKAQIQAQVQGQTQKSASTKEAQKDEGIDEKPAEPAVRELLDLCENVESNYKTEIDDLWSKCVEDAKKPNGEESKGPPPPPDFTKIDEAILKNPFLRRMVRAPEGDGSMPVIQKFVISKSEYELPQCLLYDLLLERFNFHAAVVPDYSLRKQLVDCEPNLKHK